MTNTPCTFDLPSMAVLPAPSVLPPTIVDRARGALLGLAVGDALGTTLEFSHRDTHLHHTEMIGGGPFNLAAGTFTDDTSMALALAASLLHCNGFQPRDLMDRFVGWFREGHYSPTGHCFDIGLATRDALLYYERTGEPFAGSTESHTAGNGSLMRVAPVALFALHDEARATRIAGEQSRITHGAAAAVEACQLFVTLLRAAILGQRNIVSAAARLGRTYPTLRHVTARRWRSVSRDEVDASGYVLSTLPASLWAIANTTSFEDALVLAVNLGQDADTTGAVTGQLAGAIYGASAIPQRWLEQLAWRDQIQMTADRLLEVTVAHSASAILEGTSSIVFRPEGRQARP